VSDADEFASVRRDPDPISRGRRATELLTLYQQRAAELARLRRAAIEQAHRERDMSYTEIASALGITKGRVTQIRSTAPVAERAFFGVGPVAIGVPYRYQRTDRERPLIAAEDAAAAERAEQLLTGLGFAISRFQIEPERVEQPPGDAVVICGPKSAPMAENLISRDPALSIVEDSGRWWIEQEDSDLRHGSPADEPNPDAADLAYVARHREGNRSLVHIAGLHAIGSLGAVHYLTNHLAATFRDTADESFSCIIRAQYDGIEIVGSELVAGPFLW
jgi:hypothetical protein